jgi:glycosyltransferase involved in cell wall biosynthesis
LSIWLPFSSFLVKGEFKALLDGERIGVNYDAGNPVSLAECVRLLSSQPEALGQMGQRALELFEERFSMEAICPQFVEHLMSIARTATLRPTHV